MSEKTTSGGTLDQFSFLSERAKRREESPIRALVPLLAVPGMLSLFGGLPNTSLFPFNNIIFNLRDGSQTTLEGPLLNEALTYTPSFGIAPFVKWLTEFQKKEHKPLYDDWQIMVVDGSQDGLAKAFDMLLDPQDTLLTEDPTYIGAISALKPLGCKAVGIESDIKGIIPSALTTMLANWDHSTKFPKALYVIPTGQNPSGSTLPNERRVEIYKICQMYNLVILEDDPYWNLRFDDEPLVSFFSLDTDKRVIRFDSFSKIISAGFRIGWVTCPKGPFLDKLHWDQQATSLHASGLSQAAILSVLQQWGEDGWTKQVQLVQQFYKARRDVFIAIVKKHLEGLAEWNVPNAGMFLWIKLKGIADSNELIQKKAMEKRVILMPGCHFVPGGGASPYVRASFSLSTDEQMEMAMERLRNLLEERQDALQSSEH